MNVKVTRLLFVSRTAARREAENMTVSPIWPPDSHKTASG
jgi:hypothetical protein